MIVRVGLLDKSDDYISRLANYQNVHSKPTQFHAGDTIRMADIVFSVVAGA